MNPTEKLFASLHDAYSGRIMDIARFLNNLKA